MQPDLGYKHSLPYVRKSMSDPCMTLVRKIIILNKYPIKINLRIYITNSSRYLLVSQKLVIVYFVDDTQKSLEYSGTRVYPLHIQCSTIKNNSLLVNLIHSYVVLFNDSSIMLPKSIWLKRLRPFNLSLLIKIEDWLSMIVI